MDLVKAVPEMTNKGPAVRYRISSAGLVKTGYLEFAVAKWKMQSTFGKKRKFKISKWQQQVLKPEAQGSCG